MRGYYTVSVPLRGFCFSTPTRPPCSLLVGLWFPSPYGDFVFQLHCLAAGRYGGQSCFRPLTGILFFNPYYYSCPKKILDAFPSPYGDFVFQHFRSDWHIITFSREFPSPYGDFVFQLEDVKIRNKNWKASFPSPYGDFVFQPV